LAVHPAAVTRMLLRAAIQRSRSASDMPAKASSSPANVAGLVMDLGGTFAGTGG
jgi:hypothetical protein